MSKTSRSFEQVSEHFKCPIHLGKLREPRRLPCEHTLCKDCLKGLIKSALKREDKNATFDCPECRATHHIPNTETEDWADWFPVDAFCVIQLQTLARFQDSHVCEVHEDKFKEYYCFHHRDLFCPDCIIAKHTVAPCYARNTRDAASEVKKHIGDLLGQLRLQEEHAIRIANSKVAAAHTDDLLQKVWEVEHLLDRFHKQMKKKIQETKVQIENATKIKPADKEHLKTTQALITQTKKLVDDKLKSVNIKTQEGQNDMLRLWRPLQDQVEHFQAVLTAVEKRPFCVNVQADEHVMELVNLNLDPVVVLNESAQWTPLNPITVRRIPSGNSFKSRRIRSFREKDKKATFSDRIRTQVSPRSNDANTSFPKSRSSYRTVSVHTQPIGSSGSPRQPSSVQQKLQERNPTILPKLTAGGLTTGETSKVFNIRSLTLKGISQQSIFELPCEDIVVLANNIITITERAVQKFSLRYQFLQSMALRAPIKLCYTRDESSNILVLDNSCGVSLVSTHPRLQLLYRIETDRAYSGLCHMRTTMTEDPYGRCMYHLHLALTHVWNREDCIDVMVVTYEKLQIMSGLIEEITLTPAKVKTICGSNDDPFLKNMNSICTAPDSRKLLIGTEAGVASMSRSGDIIWTVPTQNLVCSVDSRRGLVYAAIEKEKRVFILDQHGNMMVENIFPPASTVSKPSRVAVGKSSLIVREFTDNDQHGLKSMVHVFSLSF
ncbi:uncharacterized protein LOC123527145 [Mercenaria mercenaria]|uniref:uncharacterized protein LOC123527145 n=1 Tax=Mercenaria mercenaria TaxID=6596 RepID=UPI00234EF62F|nr:uncharacterized protein LOC123527145 [Mercenaria mercenaria]